MMTTSIGTLSELLIFALDLLSQLVNCLLQLVLVIFGSLQLLLKMMNLSCVLLTVGSQIFNGSLLFLNSVLSLSEFLFVYLVHFEFLLKRTDALFLLNPMAVIFL